MNYKTLEEIISYEKQHKSEEPNYIHNLRKMFIIFRAKYKNKGLIEQLKEYYKLSTNPRINKAIILDTWELINNIRYKKYL